MMKALALFSRKKINRPFKEYHAEWFNTLKNTLLPLLRRSISSSSPPMPSLLSTHVETLLHHFQSYYEALDLAASDDVSQLLFPEWRNSLEKPFLWLGDFHPYLFTNLLRSFFDDEDDDSEDPDEDDIEIWRNWEFSDKPWQIAMAWKNLPKTLTIRVDQIECGLRLMAPALVNRARDVQAGFIDRVGMDWAKFEGKKEGSKAAIGEDVTAQMDELVSVFMDANRLRRSVLAEIVAATNVYQAALFLEGLAQFLVGFRDSDLVNEFERGCEGLDCSLMHCHVNGNQIQFQHINYIACLDQFEKPGYDSSLGRCKSMSQFSTSSS